MGQCDPVNLEGYLERQRAAMDAELRDDAVDMLERARQRRAEKARMIAEEAARKTMLEAERRHEKQFNDPDLFVRLLDDKPVKVQIVEAETKSDPGAMCYGLAMLAGVFAGVAVVMLAFLITGII